MSMKYLVGALVGCVALVGGGYIGVVYCSPEAVHSAQPPQTQTSPRPSEPGGISPPACDARPAEAEMKRELEYAREMRECFLLALRTWRKETIWTYCTPEFRKQVTEPSTLPHMTWTVESEVVSPDGREISVRGMLSGRSPNGVYPDPKPRRFFMLLVRQPDEGRERWLVAQFGSVEHEDRNKPDR